MSRYVRGGWAEKYQSLRENAEAPTTKAAAKVNVCHPEEKDFSVDAVEGVREIDLCTDVVVRGEGFGGGAFPSDCIHKHLTICWFMSTWVEVCA